MITVPPPPRMSILEITREKSQTKTTKCVSSTKQEKKNPRLVKFPASERIRFQNAKHAAVRTRPLTRAAAMASPPPQIDRPASLPISLQPPRDTSSALISRLIPPADRTRQVNLRQKYEVCGNFIWRDWEPVIGRL